MVTQHELQLNKHAQVVYMTVLRARKLLSFLCRDAAETLQSQSYGKKDAQENLQNLLITNNYLPCETRILLSTILVYAL